MGINISKSKPSSEKNTELTNYESIGTPANTTSPIQENNEGPEFLSIDNNENKYSNENIEFLAEACNNEFNDMEMQLLFYILGSNVSKIPTHKMGEQFAKYHYLLAKYTEMNIYSEKKKLIIAFYISKR